MMNGADVFVAGASVGIDLSGGGVPEGIPAFACATEMRVVAPPPPLNQSDQGQQHQRDAASGGAKIDLDKVGQKLTAFKRWTVETYRHSKQHVLEHLGKVDRTVDLQFEKECEMLHDLHRRYGQLLLALEREATSARDSSEAGRAVSEALYQISLREHLIRDECQSQSESVRSLVAANEPLCTALDAAVSSVRTLVEHTIQDTIVSVEKTQTARLEMDACRGELMETENRNVPMDELMAVRARLADSVSHYEQCKRDARIKLKLLEENRIKVMRHQLAVLAKVRLGVRDAEHPLLQSAVKQVESVKPIESFLH